MKVELMIKTSLEVAYIAVDAEVRYWDDATVNGVEDKDGTLIPMRVGEYWKPLIELETGRVIDWPEGITADIHYKVCDQGIYTLLDPCRRPVARYKSDYVPSEVLCFGKTGQSGNYIIMKIDATGHVVGWSPKICSDWWRPA